MSGSTGDPSVAAGLPLVAPLLYRFAKTTNGTGEENERLPPPIGVAKGLLVGVSPTIMPEKGRATGTPAREKMDVVAFTSKMRPRKGSAYTEATIRKGTILGGPDCCNSPVPSPIKFELSD